MSTTCSAQDSRQLAGTRWQLDTSGSSAGFRVPNLWGLASVKGGFQRLDGRLELDGDERWSMELTLDAAGLGSGNRRRDRHLRSAAFFDVEHHPEVRFRSSSVHDHGGGRLRVDGELRRDGAPRCSSRSPSSTPATCSSSTPRRPSTSDCWA